MSAGIQSPVSADGAPPTPWPGPARRLLELVQGPPRAVHPIAWWAWAAGVAGAASRTTNLVLLGLLGGALALVVTARRGQESWGGAFGVFLKIALVVVGIRVVLQALLVGGTGATVLFTLPTIALPAWFAGVALGGPVTGEAVLLAVCDGARLAVILVCFGAANSLASPARLLRSMPRGLHAAGVAISVALSVAPQLVSAAGRVRRGRRLRGMPTSGPRALVGIAVPVLEEALDGSLATASALDSRGFGRRGPASPATDAAVAGLLLAGPGLLVLGLYALFVGASVTVPMLGTDAVGALATGLGTLCIVSGTALAGRGVQITRYRPDPWRLPEYATVACGVAAAALVAAAAPEVLLPPVWRIGLPGLDLAAAAGVAAAALPAVLTPPRDAP